MLSPMQYFKWSLLALTGALTCASANSPDYNNLTAALVRSAPVNWPMPILNKTWTGVKFDINGTVDYAVSLIEDASQAGANLIVFPEVWFPGYPKALDNDAWIAEHIHDYVANSLEVGSPQWHQLLTAASQNAIYVVLGFSEKTNSSLYMAQALISPYGELLHLRHKVRPSGGERDIWSDGTMDGLKVLDTPYGRWGILECWEHFHPTMTFNMAAQLETLHIAAFPYQAEFGNPDTLPFEDASLNVAAAQVYAVNSGATTLFTSVGLAGIITNEGLIQKFNNATSSMKDEPIFYYSINVTDAHDSKTYNINGEQSWGVLQEIESGWPYYIPKVIGTYVLQKTVLITDLFAYAAGYNSTTGNDTVSLP